jgi:hypothetical protein
MAPTRSEKAEAGRAAKLEKDKADRAAKAEKDTAQKTEEHGGDSDRSRSSRGLLRGPGSVDGSGDEVMGASSKPDAPAASAAMPVSMESIAATLATLVAGIAQQKADSDKISSLMSAFTTKFGEITMNSTRVDASLTSIHARLDAHAADLAALNAGRGAHPSSASSGPGPTVFARAPPASRVGGGRSSHPSAAGTHDEQRTKVFFNKFPAAIPRRLGVAWFEALYAKTNKEPGVEHHIGSQSSFAVSFPSPEGATRFMDDVRSKNLELSYTLRGGEPTTILMEPQYKPPTLFGKAMSSIWPFFTKHFEDAADTDDDHLRLLFDSHRGRIRAEVGELVVQLGHIQQDGALYLDQGGLDIVGFSAADILAIKGAFVA